MRSNNRFFAMCIMAGVTLLSSFTGVAAAADMNFESSLDKGFGQSGRFEVGPFVGYHYFEDKQNLKDDLSYGGRFGYNFSDRLGAEISLGVVKTNIDNGALVGVAKGQYRSPIDGVELKSYQLDAIYQFNPGRRLSPFVTAGIGRNMYSPDALDNDTNTINLGVGAKYWIKEDFAVRVDVRAFEEKNFRNYCGTVQLVYAFGDRKRSEKIVVAKAEPRLEPVAEPVEVVEVSDEAPMVEEKVQRIAARQKVSAEPGTVVLVFEDVHFNFDSSTLTSTAKTILKRSIQILQENPETRIRIAGYTSASGSDEYNQRLSERRASAVEKYLINEGLISTDRLTTVGYGETNAAQFEKNPNKRYSTAALANMRVIFETIID